MSLSGRRSISRMAPSGQRDRRDMRCPHRTTLEPQCAIRAGIRRRRLPLRSTSLARPLVAPQTPDCINNCYETESQVLAGDSRFRSSHLLLVRRVQSLIAGLHDTTHSVEGEMYMQSGIKTAGRVSLVAIVAALAPLAIHAQNIGWEGETGVFVTPLAYTVGSPANGFSRPTVGFHYLAAGNVIGDFYETSVTMGAFSRTEFG